MYVKSAVSAADKPWNNQWCVSSIELYRREFLVVVMCASVLRVVVVAGRSLHWHVPQQLYIQMNGLCWPSHCIVAAWQSLATMRYTRRKWALVHPCVSVNIGLVSAALQQHRSRGTAISSRTKLLWHCDTKVTTYIPWSFNFVPGICVKTCFVLWFGILGDHLGRQCSMYTHPIPLLAYTYTSDL